MKRSAILIPVRAGWLVLMSCVPFTFGGSWIRYAGNYRHSLTKYFSPMLNHFDPVTNVFTAVMNDIDLSPIVFEEVSIGLRAG